MIVERDGKRKGAGGYRLDADPSECVIWDGNVNKNGYGRIWVEENGGGRALRYAHRVAWEATYYPIPEGMTVDHLCVVNPACVNPKHLEIVTRSENQRRVDSRVTHCPRGHEYTPENTGRHSVQLGRFCRTCHRERQRARRGGSA